MKRLIIDGHEYTAETAVGLIEMIKELHWSAGENATAEEYITLQEETYKKMTGRSMKLPKADTETRAREMFKKIALRGAWEYEEREKIYE